MRSLKVSLLIISGVICAHFETNAETAAPIVPTTKDYQDCSSFNPPDFDVHGQWTLNNKTGKSEYTIKAAHVLKTETKPTADGGSLTEYLIRSALPATTTVEIDGKKEVRQEFTRDTVRVQRDAQGRPTEITAKSTESWHRESISRRLTPSYSQGLNLDKERTGTLLQSYTARYVYIGNTCYLDQIVLRNTDYNSAPHVAYDRALCKELKEVSGSFNSDQIEVCDGLLKRMMTAFQNGQKRVTSSGATLNMAYPLPGYGGVKQLARSELNFKRLNPLEELFMTTARCSVQMGGDDWKRMIDAERASLKIRTDDTQDKSTAR